MSPKFHIATGKNDYGVTTYQASFGDTGLVQTGTLSIDSEAIELLYLMRVTIYRKPVQEDYTSSALRDALVEVGYCKDYYK